MNTDRIKELIEIFAQSPIAVLEVEDSGTRILMKKSKDEVFCENFTEDSINKLKVSQESILVDSSSDLDNKKNVQAPKSEKNIDSSVPSNTKKHELNVSTEQESLFEGNALSESDLQLFETSKKSSSKKGVSNKIDKSNNHEQVKWLEVKSPMVGVFYSSKSAGENALVKVGDKVSAQQSVCVIESMNIMNEIEAGQDGIVRKICKQDCEPVEYGSVLFYIEPIKSVKE